MFIFCRIMLFLNLAFVFVNSNDPDQDNPFSNIVKRLLVATARSCMDHVNSTTDDLEYLRNDPPWPEKSACIVKCLLEQIGIVKKDRYSKQGFMTVVTPLVFRNHKKLEHLKVVSESCDKQINHEKDTICKLGNEIPTCIFKYAPELHFKAK